MAAKLRENFVEGILAVEFSSLTKTREEMQDVQINELRTTTNAPYKAVEKIIKKTTTKS